MEVDTQCHWFINLLTCLPFGDVFIVQWVKLWNRQRCFSLPMTSHLWAWLEETYQQTSPGGRWCVCVFQVLFFFCDGWIYWGCYWSCWLIGFFCEILWVSQCSWVFWQRKASCSKRLGLESIWVYLKLGDRLLTPFEELNMILGRSIWRQCSR